MTVPEIATQLTVDREIFAVVLFLSLLPLLSAGKFKAGQVPMSQIIPLLAQHCLGKYKM